MIAPSSARSERTGQGSCSAGKSRATRAMSRAAFAGIGADDRDDGGDVDGVVLRVPAIVVRHHRDGGVGDLGLAGELRLGHVGHADHVVAVLPVGRGFGMGRELRSLHADIGAAAREGDALGGRGVGDTLLQARADGCAIETWATQPLPKKELSRLCVRSTNWSTSTNRPG